MLFATLLAYFVILVGLAESKPNSKFEDDNAIFSNMMIPKMLKPNLFLPNANAGFEFEPNPILLVYYQRRNKLKTQTKRCRSEGIWPHEDDCRVFVRCRYAPTENVFYYQERTCPEGLAFDPQLESCNYLQRVTSCARTITMTKGPSKSTSIASVYHGGEETLGDQVIRRMQDEERPNHVDDDNDEAQPLAMPSFYTPELKSEHPTKDNKEEETPATTSRDRKTNGLQATIKIEHKTTKSTTAATVNKSSKGKDCADQSNDNSNKTNKKSSGPNRASTSRAKVPSTKGKKKSTSGTTSSTTTTTIPLAITGAPQTKTKSSSTRKVVSKPKVESFGLPPLSEPARIEQRNMVK